MRDPHEMDGRRGETHAEHLLGRRGFPSEGFHNVDDHRTRLVGRNGLGDSLDSLGELAVAGG